MGALVLLVLGGIWQWHTVSHRVLDERGVYAKVLEQGLDKAPLTSVTKRLWMWRFGIERWEERPILGWGPRNLHFVAKDYPIIKKLPHVSMLHNTYVDILARFGLIGFVLYAVQCLLVLGGTLRGYRKGIIEKDLAVFLVGAGGMLLVWSLTDVRLNHPQMSFFVALLGGIGYGVGLKARALPAPGEAPARGQRA